MVSLLILNCRTGGDAEQQMVILIIYKFFKMLYYSYHHDQLISKREIGRHPGKNYLTSARAIKGGRYAVR